MTAIIVILVILIIALTSSAAMNSAAASSPLCGYVVDIQCPGCENNNPGGCACAPINEQCNCNNNQLKVECNTANYTYQITPNGGNKLSISSEAETCTIVKKCMMEDGDQVGCGTYHVPGYCVVQAPPNQPCQWRDFFSTTAPVWTQGDPCP